MRKFIDLVETASHIEKALTDREYQDWMMEERGEDFLTTRARFKEAIMAFAQHPLLNRWVPRVQWSKNAEQIPH